MLETANQNRKPYRLIDMVNATLARLSAEIDELGTAEAEARSFGEVQAVDDRRRLIRLDLADLSAAYEHLAK